MGASETVSALSDLLNSQPMTARQAAEKAAAEGIDLRYGTLAGYWAGNHGRPTRRTLAKLAQVVPQLSETQLQEAAWGKPAPLGPYQPPEESVHLTEPQRRALDGLIKSIVDAQGATHAHSPAPANPPSSSGAPHEEKQVEEVTASVSDGGPAETSSGDGNERNGDDEVAADKAKQARQAARRALGGAPNPVEKPEGTRQ